MWGTKLVLAFLLATSLGAQEVTQYCDEIPGSNGVCSQDWIFGGHGYFDEIEFKIGTNNLLIDHDSESRIYFHRGKMFENFWDIRPMEYDPDARTAALGISSDSTSRITLNSRFKIDADQFDKEVFCYIQFKAVGNSKKNGKTVGSYEISTLENQATLKLSGPSAYNPSVDAWWEQYEGIEFIFPEKQHIAGVTFKMHRNRYISHVSCSRMWWEQLDSYGTLPISFEDIILAFTGNRDTSCVRALHFVKQIKTKKVVLDESFSAEENQVNKEYEQMIKEAISMANEGKHDLIEYDENSCPSTDKSTQMHYIDQDHTKEPKNSAVYPVISRERIVLDASDFH